MKVVVVVTAVMAWAAVGVGTEEQPTLEVVQHSLVKRQNFPGFFRQGGVFPINFQGGGGGGGGGGGRGNRFNGGRRGNRGRRQGNRGRGNRGRGNRGQGNRGQGNRGQGNRGQGNRGQGNGGKKVNCNRKKNQDNPECIRQAQELIQDNPQLFQSLPWLAELARGRDNIAIPRLPNTPARQANKRFFQLATGEPDIPHQNCVAPGFEEGRCRYLQHCVLPEFASSFNNFLQYLCFIDGVYVGACCPLRVNQNGLTPSTPAPTTPAPTPRPTPAPQSRGCGIVAKPPPTRIVGGKPADPQEWPWIAALMREGSTQYCGGALISDRHVMTAAHCVVGFSQSSITVRLGEYTFDQNGETKHLDFRVLSIKPHEAYDTTTYVNDIAVITIDGSTEFTNDIWPVCLPEGDDLYVGRQATVIGWGTIYYGGPVSSTLQEVTIPVWTNQECDAAYEQDIIDKQLCAGAKEGGKDSCQGDSGGPLLVQQGGANRWAMIGVVSWGIRCAEPGNPGVYTRVSAYRDWIRSAMQG